MFSRGRYRVTHSLIHGAWRLLSLAAFRSIFVLGITFETNFRVMKLPSEVHPPMLTGPAGSPLLLFLLRKIPSFEALTPIYFARLSCFFRTPLAPCTFFNGGVRGCSFFPFMLPPIPCTSLFRVGRSSCLTLPMDAPSFLDSVL